ncbi:MAG: hypothetical protein M1822_005689 [Bathelium mastoideum]|nr:MAG: hypothetical protein M1822_005689 [Bathelium mastoideum]
MSVKNDVEDGVLTDAPSSPVRSIQGSKAEPDFQHSIEELVPQGHDNSARTVHGWKWVLVCLSLYTSGLIYGLDTTIAADIQAAIVEKFDNVERLTWVGTGFPLGSVASILPAASLYSNFDLKVLFMSSVLLFEIGSAVCGAAPTMNALIVGRVIAGMGGSGVYIGVLNYFSLCTTEKERGGYISGIGVVWGLGAVLGPVVGGAFSTSSATWRWAFYINLVIAAVFLPAYIFYLPSVKPPGSQQISAWAKLKKMDWLGFLLGIAAVASFTIALTFAGPLWAWNDGRTIATFVVSGVMLIWMLLQQYFVIFTTRENRMFPPRHILSDKTLILLNAITASGSANIFIPVYYIPIFFVFTHGDSALMAAVRLLPYIVFLAAFNMAVGVLLKRVNYYWALFLLGGILMTIGGATMYTVRTDTSAAKIYGYSLLLGTGTGLSFQSAYTVGPVKTFMKTGSGADIQHVISMLNLSQLSFQLGALLICGQIFQSLAVRNLDKVLHGSGFSAEDIRAAVAGTQSKVLESVSPALKQQAIDAITDAMGKVYILSFSVGAVAVVCALLLPKEKLFNASTPRIAAGGA